MHAVSMLTGQVRRQHPRLNPLSILSAPGCPVQGGQRRLLLASMRPASCGRRRWLWPQVLADLNRSVQRVDVAEALHQWAQQDQVCLVSRHCQLLKSTRRSALPASREKTVVAWPFYMPMFFDINMLVCLLERHEPP